MFFLFIGGERLSLEDVINGKLKEWAKTEKGRKAIGNSLKSSDVGGHSPTNDIMMKYAQRMRDILREEIADIISTTTGDDFLNYIDIDKSVSVVQTQGKEYLSVSLSFNKDIVTRRSLFPQKYKPVFMPAIVNNDWNITTPNTVYGYDRHDTFNVGTKEWKYSQDKGFMQRAVSRFNAEMSSKGVKAECNVNYDGGTYGTKEY